MPNHISSVCFDGDGDKKKGKGTDTKECAYRLKFNGLF